MKHHRTRKRSIEHLTNLTAAAQGTGADFENRRIYLIGTIDEAFAARFMVAFRTMDDTPGAIEIILCSAGGEESAGFGMYDLLRLARNSVTIVVYGECMSVSALILQGATKRLLSPEAQFMIHNGHVNMAGDVGGVQIDADDMVRYAAEIKKNNHRYHLALAERSGTDIRAIKDMCEAETFMSATEAVAKGFADGVLELPKRKPRKRVKK